MGSIRGFGSFVFLSFIRPDESRSDNAEDNLEIKSPFRQAMIDTFPKSFLTGKKHSINNTLDNSDEPFPVSYAFLFYLLVYIDSADLLERKEKIKKTEIFLTFFKFIISAPLGILQFFTEVFPLTISLWCAQTIHSENSALIKKIAAGIVGGVANIWYFLGRIFTSPSESISIAGQEKQGGLIGRLLVLMFVIFLHVLITAAIVNLLIASGPLSPFFITLANTIAINAPWFNTIGVAFSTFVLPTWGAVLGGGSTLLNIVLASTFFLTPIGVIIKSLIRNVAINGFNFKKKLTLEYFSSDNSEEDEGAKTPNKEEQQDILKENNTWTEDNITSPSITQNHAPEPPALIEKLPKDILNIIIKLLPLKDLFSIVKLNKFFKNFMEKNFDFSVDFSRFFQASFFYRKIVALYPNVLPQDIVGSTKKMRYIFDSFKGSNNWSEDEYTDYKNTLKFYYKQIHDKNTDSLPIQCRYLLAIILNDNCIGANVHTLNALFEYDGSKISLNKCATLLKRQDHQKLKIELQDIQVLRQELQKSELKIKRQQTKNFENKLTKTSLLYLIEPLDLVKCDNYGRSLLAWAKFLGRDNLLKYFFDIFLKTNEPLKDYGRYLDPVKTLFLACLCGQTDVVLDLFKPNNPHEYNTNTLNTLARGYENLSFLAAACFGGHFEIVELLIKTGARTDTFIFDDNNPLAIACKNGHIEIVNLLLLNKNTIVNPRATSVVGSTPLYHACFSGNAEIVGLLIDKGAEITNQFNDKHPLYIACEKGYFELVKLLLKNSKFEPEAISQLFSFACECNHLEIVEFLLKEHEAQISTSENEYRRLLNNACALGHFEIARLFLDKGKKAKLVDDFFSTALYHVCKNGHCKMLELFFSLEGRNLYDIDLNHKDIKGNTFLSIACEYYRFHVVEKLLALGANPNTYNVEGKTPLDIACQKNHPYIVKPLLDKGAIPNQKLLNKTDNKDIKELLKAALENQEKVKPKQTPETSASTEPTSVTPLQTSLLINS